jgi:outer membrane protein assembly factor BamB
MLRARPAVWIALLSFVSTSLAPAADPPVNDGLTVSADDWPWWRGPTRNGIANPDPLPPLHWSDSEHVVWKTPIPGKGHGSPIVVGNHVYLQTAESEPQSQSLLCLDRKTGNVLWKAKVHEGGQVEKQNAKSTSANNTPACDGQRVFVNFINRDAVYTTALDLRGKPIWQQKITDYVVHQGFSTSPALYQDLVIVSADNTGGGALAALDRKSGEFQWRIPRPSTPNYTSPIILHVAGRDQLLFIGCDRVTSLDPLSGKPFWEMPGATTECVTSTITDGMLIYTSGGYPKNHIAAVRADGSKEIAWEQATRVYVPSMVLKDGYLYAALDAGIVQCLKADTGHEEWKQRVGGTFSSSLVLAGDRIYATDESGRTLIFAADPKRYQLLAENQLGQSVFATPAICGGRIYHRIATDVGGQRQEFVYCLGEK